MQKWIVFVVFLSICILTFGQNDTLVKHDDANIVPLEISEEHLKPFLEDEAFNYEIIKTDNSGWDNFKDWMYNILLQIFEWLFGVEAAVGAVASFLQILPYILLGILLFLIIGFFVKANTRSLIYTQKNPNIVSLSEEERIIKTEDIQQLIRDALAQNNYRLAIRYYYLFILKLLTERELIEWQLQKTNDDYIAELSNSQLKTPFSRATLLYDYIWYGEFNIDQDRYTKAEQVFVTLKNAIATDV
ncbi:DUF4129 domain-containing protein [Flagellimonas flava]|uniref:DUF4129 domain-containing protein n=1 Tax=Flagellimonas flava TaxID=570519 RepID=UPI003D65C5F0